MPRTAPIITDRNPDAIPAYTLITVRERGLLRCQFAIDAACTAEIVTFPSSERGGAPLQLGIVVDGIVYPLAYQRWVDERPELRDAIDRVLEAARAAIDAERAALDMLPPEQYAETLRQFAVAAELAGAA